MHSLEELTKELNLTYNQLRHRLRLLGTAISQHLSKGKKGKILISNNGLIILRKMIELERDGRSIEAAAQAVIEELAGNGDSQSAQFVTTQSQTVTMQLLEAKERLIAKLDEEVRYLRMQNEQLTKIIEEKLAQLPPAREEIQQKIQAKASRWLRFKQLLKGE